MHEEISQSDKKIQDLESQLQLQTKSENEQVTLLEKWKEEMQAKIESLEQELKKEVRLKEEMELKCEEQAENFK